MTNQKFGQKLGIARATRPTHMRTIMGRELSIFAPDPKLLCILDVAHGLAHLCRYAGHVRHFYSVAEHSYWTSIIAPQHLALSCLLHDAAETNINDLIQPVKQHISGYQRIENGFESAYAEQFGLPFPFPPEVKATDRAIYQIECTQARHLNSTLDIEEPESLTPTAIKVKLRFWSPRKARKKFLRRYFFLTDKDSNQMTKRLRAWWRERALTLRFYLQLDFAPVK
ncbi:MAG: hypothetical protein JST84_04700 [Acidobacteria bacterium]|nr:hypothetical protein [Acidobacteriota bacterium]